jgi:hypothetical protein
LFFIKDFYEKIKEDNIITPKVDRFYKYLMKKYNS